MIVEGTGMVPLSVPDAEAMGRLENGDEFPHDARQAPEENEKDMTQPVVSASQSNQNPSLMPIDDRAWAKRIKADVLSNYHHEMAQAISREGSMEAAAAAFERAILVNPGWSAPYVGLIDLLDRQGRSNERAAVADQARSIIPMFDQEAEVIILQREIEILHGKNRLGEAESLLDKVYFLIKSQKFPSFIEDGVGKTLLNHAMALPWEDITKATLFLSRTLEIEPQSSFALEQIGIRLHTLGNLDAAQEAYGKAAQLRPSALTFARMSDIFTLKLRFQDAERAARMALDIDAKESEAIFWLGVSLALQTRLDEAEAVLENGVKVAPADAPLYAELGFVRMLQGRLDGVESLLRKAISMAPHHPILYAYLGLFTLRAGNIERSIAILQGAIQLFPKNGVLYTNLGLSLQLGKRGGDALAAHRRAMALHPEMMPLWIARRLWAADALIPLYKDLGVEMEALMYV